MGNICPPSHSSLLHYLSTTLGGCLNACSEDTFVLEWLLNRTETLPRYLSFLACLKISPVLLHIGLAVHLPVDDSSSWQWSDVHEAKAIYGVAEAAGGEGGLWDHIPPLPWQGSLPNDFDQASSLSCFQGKLLSPMHGGIWKGAHVQTINASTGCLLCVCVSADQKCLCPFS